MTEENLPILSKVISIKSRKPFINNKNIDEDINAPLDIDIDRMSLEALDVCKKLIQSGEVNGTCIMMFNTKTRLFEFMITLPENEDPKESAMKYIGGISLLKEQVTDLYYYNIDAEVEESPNDEAS